jgi:hypothetical protein
MNVSHLETFFFLHKDFYLFLFFNINFGVNKEYLLHVTHCIRFISLLFFG